MSIQEGFFQKQKIPFISIINIYILTQNYVMGNELKKSND